MSKPSINAESTKGCIAWMLPEDTIKAVAEAWAFFISKEWLNTEVTGAAAWQQPCYAMWFNLPLCASVACCSCVYFAAYIRNQEQMTGKSCESQFLAEVVASFLCLSPCRYAVLRRDFRKKYDLRGSPAYDCLMACCGCGPCLLCQDANEIMYRDSKYTIPMAPFPGSTTTTTATA